VEGMHRLNLDREQVLARLWEIAKLSPEMTRGSVTGQVKALSMIVAMENFIPDRRAVSSETKSAPAPAKLQIYVAEWLREQQAKAIDPQPSPAPDPQQHHEEALRKRHQWPLMAPGSLLFQTREVLLFQTQEFPSL
jgi:hypothetical protein